MDLIDQQTLKDLEFPVILSWLESNAQGSTAKDRISSLRPYSDKKTCIIELNKVQELKEIRVEGLPFPALDFQELTIEIKLLPIINSVLSLEGYIRIAVASELCNRLCDFFSRNMSRFTVLENILADVYSTNDIIDPIFKVFDPSGNVKDHASDLLFEIRQKIQSVRIQINKNFEKELRRLEKENVLGDTRETFLNDRRVLTILSTYKRKISGNVVGSSKTGSLTFIEPEVNIPLNNELELLLDDERKEIYRILKKLNETLLIHLPLIKEYQRLLTEFDFVNAKTRLALQLNCSLPSINQDRELELIAVYHPILWKNNQNQGKVTYPQHIQMDKFSRMLVISGPNAGGKSITLKTVGIIQLMLQSGLLVPLHENSRMFFFDKILSDIGDNQSIENELSTYSYRLKRMKLFLEVSNKNTLLLLDEFGTGSDPDLGGALAEVFFEELYNRKSFGVITTHYANIKLKANQLKNVVNGCMLFDTETLEPLYKFSAGQPGSSFTFEVAQINGIPIDILDKAKLKLDDRKVKMDRLLSELQKEKTYLERLNKEHIEAQEIAQHARNEFEDQKSKYEEKLKNLQLTTERDNKYIIAGKKMLSFIDRYVYKSRKKDVNKPLFDDIQKYVAVEKAKIEEAKKITQLKKSVQNKPIKKTKVSKQPSDPYNQMKIVEGSQVKLISTKQSGTVKSVDGNQITVVFGFMTMKVEREKLIWIK